MNKITPFLWFDDDAEEAMRFYTSVFKNSTVDENETGAACFTLEGLPFIAFNGGPHFKFNEAVSFLVSCEDQAEVDELSEKLSEGGQKSQCGWLKDQFGVSWQIVPTILSKLLNDDDAAKADNVMQAMLKMTKLDIAALQAAYDGA